MELLLWSNVIGAANDAELKNFLLRLYAEKETVDMMVSIDLFNREDGKDDIRKI